MGGMPGADYICDIYVMLKEHSLTLTLTLTIYAMLKEHRRRLGLRVIAHWRGGHATTAMLSPAVSPISSSHPRARALALALALALVPALSVQGIVHSLLRGCCIPHGARSMSAQP